MFVTPAVDGWVLVVGPDAAAREGDEAAFVAPLLERLSSAFGEAQWFATFADADRHGWAVACGGVLQRAYAYSGEQGHVWWHGERTRAETDHGCFVDDPRDRSDDEVKWWPDAACVRGLAAAWSVDPARLGERALPKSAGLVGRL